jgi:phospholipid/cholesterol/gamma-HCH transport system substrate-binding protein
VFDPRVTGQIVIKLSIDEGAPVTTTTFAVARLPGRDRHRLHPARRRPHRLAAVEERQADHVARIPLRPGLLDQLEKRGLAILEKTEQITNSLDAFLSEENAAKITGAVDNISKAAEAYAAIPEKLQPTLARLPALESKVDKTLTSRSSNSPTAPAPPPTTTTAWPTACRRRAACSNAPPAPSSRSAA